MSPGQRLAFLVATLGGIGRLRPAPGSWASAAVLPAALLGPLACLALALALVAVGWWATRRLLGTDTDADPGWVVVDEGAGQLIALAALPMPSSGQGMLPLGMLPLSMLDGILLAFVLFRVFDIAKPGPVGWANRQHGARGVMLDDVIAGALAAAVLLLLRAVLP